jgi:hypothetical protein
VKKIVFCLLFFVFGVTVFAQVPPNYRYVKTWHISDPFAVADSIPVDTAHLNFQNDNPIDRFSIANSYNGNLISPVQSKLYFDRPNNTDFIFSNAYYPYMMNVEHATFYNTKTPYSSLKYITGGTLHRDEDKFDFLFTGNVNKRLNIGTTLEYIETPGEYNNQGAKDFSGSLFGSYDGERYTANALFSTNDLSHYENGGIKNFSEISSYETSIIPTNMVGYANYKQNVIFYNQQYSVGIERPVRISEDSVRMEYVPVTRFAHTFKLDDVRKRYYENSTQTDFYNKTYLLGTQVNDTSALQTVSNNLSVSMEEEFNKWMQFGLKAYIENEIQRYTYFNDNLLHLQFESTTKIGGILSKQRGQRFRYNINGELNFLGYKAGDVLLQGNMGGFFKLWEDSISLVANGFVRSDKPSFFLRNYQSAHFQWNNDFANIYRTRVGGTFSLPTRSFSLNVSVENITQYIYFNKYALPAQFPGNIQILAANLKKDFHVGKFTLENNVVGQVSSHQELLPLPSVTLYHNLYYHDLWFNVLGIQLGANLRYHTAYYVPAYMPATGQFYIQSTTKIGNYPVMSAYVNFHLKRTRFYVEYYHMSNMFMKGDYQSMPNYPINPVIMKMGLSWDFYD